jgi:UDP-GlcNAc:undecaprenyl-phosphate GlcNAc-1-phosphate transferase
VDVEYITDKSLMKNFKYMLLAVKVTLTKAISRQHLWETRSQLYLMMADLAACVLSFSLAHLLRYEHFAREDNLQIFFRILPWAILLRLSVFIYFGFYHTLIRHLSIFDIKRIFKGVAFSSLILVTISYLSGVAISTKPMFSSYSRSVFLIDWVLLTILLVALRIFLKKIYLRYRETGKFQDGKRVLIWGAGDAGELCLHYLKKNRDPIYTIVGFLDDDPGKRGRQIEGYKILGDRHHLKILAQLYKTQEVLVAIPSASLEELQKIIGFCQDLGLEANLFQFGAMAGTNSSQYPVQPVKPVANVAPIGWISSLDHTSGKS